MADQCVAYSISMNEIEPQFDGQWQGITSASDGSCYFASSTHSNRRGAGLFRFDPESRNLSILAEDISAVCGKDSPIPQGKIHSPIVEASGHLYFSTHLGAYWEGAPEAYPGAHILRYDIAKGVFHDFGIAKQRYTIYSAIGVDPERKKLFAFVVPWAEEDSAQGGCHLVRLDIASGKMEDLGRVGPRGRIACFWFFVDHRGDCWFSLWRAAGVFPQGGQGNLYRLPEGAGEVTVYEDILPDCHLLYPDGQALADVEDTRADRAWTWAAPLPGRERCLFLMGMFAGEDERLWTFTPKDGSLTSANFECAGLVGPTFLATALGGDRVYYIQRGNVRAARGWVAEFERDRDPSGLGWVDAYHREDLHLKSISLSSRDRGTVTDHGPVVDQDGRTPRHIDSLAADDRGRVYMVGGWHLLPGEAGTQQIQWATTREFLEVPRAERFAFVDTAASTS